MAWISVLVVGFLFLGLRTSIRERLAHRLTLILTVVVLAGVFVQMVRGA